MNAQTMGRSILPLGRNVLPLVTAGLFLWTATPAIGASQHFEKHFPVKGHPVVCIHNIGNGRIEVKSSKNSEVVVAGTQARLHLGERHMIVVSELSETIIDKVLRSLHASGELRSRTLPLK